MNKLQNYQENVFENFVVGKAVRTTIETLGGTMPEDLPTPDKSIRELEKEKLKQIIKK